MYVRFPERTAHGNVEPSGRTALARTVALAASTYWKSMIPAPFRAPSRASVTPL
jgi:hypothetical protein